METLEQLMEAWNAQADEHNKWRLEQKDAEERYLHERLDELRRAYELASKPYIERLVRIRSFRPTPPILIALDQAHSPHQLK